MLSITELEELYKNDCDFNALSLQEYKEAKKYYHSNQLPSDVEAIIKERGGVPIYENIFRLVINKILGYKTQSIQEVRVSGRQEEDKALAEVLNDLLDVFSQSENYDKEIVKRDKDLIFGLSVMQVWIKKEGEDFILDLENIPADSFVIDKYSTDSNAKDARRFHRFINTSFSFAKSLLQDANIHYIEDEAEKRVNLIESWIKEENGAFSRYIWQVGGEVLHFSPSPFKDGSHPFVIAKYAIDEKNCWYGLFRDIKPLQDYINFAENRMANMMGSFKAFFEEDAVINAESFANEASLDNAVVKVANGAIREGKIHFVEHHNDIATLTQKVNEKRSLAKILSGLNDEALGMAINRQSGVAIAQRRDAGLMGLQDFIKIGDEMDKLIFQKAINLIQHYFTKKQVFKIVDKKVGVRYFEINSNPSNSIRVGKFDLIYKTQLKTQGREERFAHWSEMLKTIAQIRPDLVASLLPLMLKDTDSPIVADVEEIIKKQEEAQKGANEENSKIQRMQLELSLQEAQAKIKELEGKALKYSAQGELAQGLAKEKQEQLKSIEEGEIDFSKYHTKGNMDNKLIQTNKGMDLR
ncbi:portal protein [Helicobacter valdiviensis]|uniref:Portal protein n=1 Tax=Helicobacter valdiviensis TaxID=1458358 RepID=A0A2W6MUI9_9HELI|nr:portal protein [Helicobacter valdiviensis]PZT48185.1 portal protein [Helicobacter valdiviensis]